MLAGSPQATAQGGEGQLSNRSRYLQAHVRVPEHPGRAGLVRVRVRVRRGGRRRPFWDTTLCVLAAAGMLTLTLLLLRGVRVRVDVDWTVLGLVHSQSVQV